MFPYVILMLAFLGCFACSGDADEECGALARTETGWVCGTWRTAQNGKLYASFRGMPYAKQPLGELRFKELQPAEPWAGVRDAAREGAVCPAHNTFYGMLQAPCAVSEACMHVNVHVPQEALPNPKEPTMCTGGLPIVIFIHGGIFVCGSGDADFHGPEYLVGDGVVVVTFNYRLDVFGFLSLGTTKIPGNNGLRDMVTLLRWVQRNARFFGGDPARVTLAGQSAGAASAHLLSLSSVSKGLFQRIWLMSGTAYPSFYSTAPAYAQHVATRFLSILGLNDTDYDTVHDMLVKMPLKTLTDASGALLSQQGMLSFSPVVEAPLKGVTAIIEEDPAILLSKGYGKDIPLVIGFTSNESQTLRHQLVAMDVLEAFKKNPLTVLSPHAVYTLPPRRSAAMAKKVAARYFGEEPTIDKYINLTNDNYFALPALKLARARAREGGAPVYSYKFDYTATYNAMKIAFNLTYTGAAHNEDLNYMYKVNSFPVPYDVDDAYMRDVMSGFLANYAKTGQPAPPGAWPPQSGALGYQRVSAPLQRHYAAISAYEQHMLNFYDALPDVSN